MLGIFGELESCRGVHEELDEVQARWILGDEKNDVNEIVNLNRMLSRRGHHRVPRRPQTRHGNHQADLFPREIERC